jgi:hypothetical protein
MNRGDYNKHRGWDISAVANPADDGYLVIYPDDYCSWSPKDVFEAAYRYIKEMPFGHAVEAMKQGKKVARAGWNDKDMFIYYVPAQQYLTTTEVGTTNFGPKAECGAYICMKPASGPLVIGWLASQTDMLAEDWQIID